MVNPAITTFVPILTLVPYYSTLPILRWGVSNLQPIYVALRLL